MGAPEIPLEPEQRPAETTVAPSSPPKALDWRLGHQPALDGLRGVAILAVLGFHGHRALRGGYIGVDLFFVLSGYLITCNLIEEDATRGKISLAQFYTRRILRLLPALVLLLAVYVVLSIVFAFPDRAKDAVTNSSLALFYVMNWVRAFELRNTSVLTHTWSLSIEEQFYILWPFLLILLLRWGCSRRMLFALLLGGAGVVAVYRATLIHGGVSVHRLYNGFDTRADALLLGCAAAFAVHALPRLRGGSFLVALGVVANFAFVALNGFFCFGCGWDHPAMYYGGLFAAGLGIVPILLAVVLRSPVCVLLNRLLLFSPLVWTGRISYGLYLWHTPVFMSFRMLAPSMPVPIRLPLSVLTSFGIAAASYYALERPFLRLKDRFTRTRRPLEFPHGTG